MRARSGIIVVAIALAAGLVAWSQAKPLKVVYFGDFAPLSSGEGRNVRGMLIDVLEEALARRMGIPVVHEGFPWARAQVMVSSGSADAFVTVPTAERLAYASFTVQPALMATFTMFVRKADGGNAELLSVRDLSGLKPHAVGSYIGSGWAKTHLEDNGIAVDWAPDMAAALRKLAAGRVRVFVDNSLVIRYNVKLLGLEDAILELPNVLDSSSWNVGISNKSAYAGIRDRLDATLKAMLADGTIRKIVDKYK